ncbi:MAG: iron-sulfur cluster carrier protein ApbC [Rhodospirillaceae bacterium]|nr:iron-sulfur cluster carrier protein ApbC [Rhodospirillaceae bacterium]MDE0361050.1 iron-sulfur cluster carrier protein ApbC [Rhodospirillaceae bacterium]
MKTDEIQALEKRLGEFEIPHATARLGSAGSRFSVDEAAEAYRVSVTLGFPVERSRAELIESLREHVAGLDLGRTITFEVDWAVESHSVQHGLKPLGSVSNLIAVASGKGGVGKSTVAVNLSLAFAQEGARVGILDADIYGPSQPRMLGLMGQRPVSRDGKSLEPLEAHGIKAMSIGFLVDERQPMAWRGPMVTSALNQLLNDTNWGQLDYLLVDMPPGTGDIQLTLSQRVPVSGAIIVTTPQEISLADARKGLEMFQKVNVPILGIVENMSRHICSRCGHEEPIFGHGGAERLAVEYDLPMLGGLPLDSRIRETTDRGEPTVVAAPDDSLARYYRQIARAAGAQLAAQGKDYSQLFPTITVEENT